MRGKILAGERRGVLLVQPWNWGRGQVGPGAQVLAGEHPAESGDGLGFLEVAAGEMVVEPAARYFQVRRGEGRPIREA